MMGKISCLQKAEELEIDIQPKYIQTVHREDSGFQPERRARLMGRGSREKFHCRDPMT